MIALQSEKTDILPRILKACLAILVSTFNQDPGLSLHLKKNSCL
jgi:hypothetical protein